ncbi:MAG: sterol desaturase family protein [Hyphomonadaceae bacterium]|nr:sterol desaturase family protein [Hyphomonadaceae bacterium]
MTLLIAFLPIAAFGIVWALERVAPAAPGPAHDRWDWTLNLVGLAVQGAGVPLLGLWLTRDVLAPALPQLAGALAIGFWGAFALNFIAIDLLYYLQHRAWHKGPLWRLHIAHHAGARVDVWATSRNTSWASFLFVYFLINPWAALLCDSPEGFYLGASATAALDLWRHGRIDYRRLGLDGAMRALAAVLIVPAAHFRHHDAAKPNANFGANLSIWDRLFGTYEVPVAAPASSAALDAPSPLRQLLWPFGARS